MIRTRYETLMARFRIMMTESGAFPKTVTDAELLSRVKGDNHDDRMHALEMVTSLVAPGYWERRGL
jgi:hypothetical protein